MSRRHGLIVAALALILFPAASAFAQFKQGDWELTLSGVATNGPDFNGVTAGAAGSIGYFVSDQFELSFRQSLTYTDLGDAASGKGSAWNGTSRLALDLHVDFGRFQPFVGANVGYIYGEAISDTFEVAPEAGIKWFLNRTTFIQFLVEYELFFDKNSDLSSALRDGEFVYTIGIGVRL